MAFFSSSVVDGEEIQLRAVGSTDEEEQRPRRMEQEEGGQASTVLQEGKRQRIVAAFSSPLSNAFSAYLVS